MLLQFDLTRGYCSEYADTRSAPTTSVYGMSRSFSHGISPHETFAFSLQAPRSLDEARRVVAKEELDVLVYPDIGMEALTYFMAFARLAPVQVLYLVCTRS